MSNLNDDISQARREQLLNNKQNQADQAREKFSNFDVSKVRNVEATEEKDPGVISESVKRKPGKFFFSDVEKVKLPSLGYLYADVTEDEDILNGFIKLKSMTVAEEKILSTQRYQKTGNIPRIILDRCIQSNIDAKDILLYDSNYLFFFLRQISYGDEYNFEITCQNSICEKKFQHTVKISELNFESLKEGIEEPIVVKLPRSKFTVKMVLPRLYHGENINDKNRNRKKNVNDENDRMIDNYIETTKEVLDEEGNRISRGDWRDFYEALPALDRAKITEETNFSTGVDTLEGVNCPYCDTVYDGLIPVGPDFFRL